MFYYPNICCGKKQFKEEKTGSKASLNLTQVKNISAASTGVAVERL